MHPRPNALLGLHTVEDEQAHICADCVDSHQGQQQESTVHGLGLIFVIVHGRLFDDADQQEDVGNNNGCLQHLWQGGRGESWGGEQVVEACVKREWAPMV